MSTCGYGQLGTWRCDLPSPRIAPRSATALIAPSCAKPGGARGGICCAPISPTMIRRGCGACTSSSSASKRRSGTSKACLTKAGGDLAIWPIFHQDEARIEAHIFIAFLAYCLHVTLGPASSRPGARPHPAQCHRKIRRCADDRSACPDHRRPRAAADPLRSPGLTRTGRLTRTADTGSRGRKAACKLAGSGGERIGNKASRCAVADPLSAERLALRVGAIRPAPG